MPVPVPVPVPVYDPSDAGIADFSLSPLPSSDLVKRDRLALPSDRPPRSLAFRLALAALLPRLTRSDAGFSSPSSAGVELRDDARECSFESVRRNDRRLAAALAS